MSRELFPASLRAIESQLTARSSGRALDEELSDRALANRIALKNRRHEAAGWAAFLGGVGTAIGFLVILL